MEGRAVIADCLLNCQLVRFLLLSCLSSIPKRLFVNFPSRIAHSLSLCHVSTFSFLYTHHTSHNTATMSQEFTYSDISEHNTKKVSRTAERVARRAKEEEDIHRMDEESARPQPAQQLVLATLELKEHLLLTRFQDLYMVVHDKVYDCSSFVDEHPYVFFSLTPHPSSQS